MRFSALTAACVLAGASLSVTFAHAAELRPAPPAGIDPSSWGCMPLASNGIKECQGYERRGNTFTPNTPVYRYQLVQTPNGYGYQLVSGPQSAPQPQAQPQASFNEVLTAHNYDDMHHGGCDHDADFEEVYQAEAGGLGPNDREGMYHAVCVKKPSFGSRAADRALDIVTVAAYAGIVKQLDDGDGYYDGRDYHPSGPYIRGGSRGGLPRVGN